MTADQSLEATVTDKSGATKTFSEIVCGESNESVLVNALQKYKEDLNGYLTELVESDKRQSAENGNSKKPANAKRKGCESSGSVDDIPWVLRVDSTMIVFFSIFRRSQQ